jgi:uncharacterized protein YndB with AHSA1/START domain
MDKGLLVKKSIFVNADEVTVWDALVNPKKIKEYLFGTDTVSDWKVGSRITYKGVWQGKEYEDGGTILQLVPGKIFQSTYWSSMSGTEDKPENYATVTMSWQKKKVVLWSRLHRIIVKLKNRKNTSKKTGAWCWKG